MLPDKVIFGGVAGEDNVFQSKDLEAATSVATVPLPAALPLFGAVISGAGVFGHRVRKRRA